MIGVSSFSHDLGQDQLPVPILGAGRFGNVPARVGFNSAGSFIAGRPLLIANNKLQDMSGGVGIYRVSVWERCRSRVLEEHFGTGCDSREVYEDIEAFSGSDKDILNTGGRFQVSTLKPDDGEIHAV